MADPEKDPILQQAVDVNPPPGPTGYGAVADQTPHKVTFISEVYKIDEDGNRYTVEEESEITLVPHDRRREPPRGYIRR